MTKLSDIKKGDRFYYSYTNANYLALKDWNSYTNEIQVTNLDVGYQTSLHYGNNKVVLEDGTYKNDLFNEHKKIDTIVSNSPDKKFKVYLGCFNKPIHGFVNVDIRPYPETKCDVVDDILKLEKFDDNSIDLILSVHTLEHLGRYEFIDALKLWYNKLRNNGEIFVSVPDMQAVFEHYIYHRDLKFLYSHIWGSQKHTADWHGHGHDFNTLSEALIEAGFKNIERYDCESMPWSYTDSYAQAYAVFKDKNSRLMSLNVKATKIK